MPSDTEYMTQAIELGEHGRTTAPPNPWVGCVIVKSDKVVGKGYHSEAGTPHAEVHALKEAGSQAEGATVYATLEPCSHHGRTPPCVDTLISAKVKRVVIGVKDPDKKVSGHGIKVLRDAGIIVDVGICQNEVENSLRPYLHHRRTGLPYCIAKAAMSIDGRTAAADTSSRWITSPEARADAHYLRALSQAIIIGASTAVLDQPKLTVRDADVDIKNQPTRVIIDPKGRLTPPSPLLDGDMAPTIIFSSKCHDYGRNIEVIPVEDEEIELSEVLQALGDRGFIQVMIEGGANLLGRSVKAGIIDRLYVYVGAKVVGDRGRPLFHGLDIGTMDEALDLELIGTKALGSSVRLEYHLSCSICRNRIT